MLPDLSRQSLPRSLALIVPVVTALVALPQLSAARRTPGLTLALAAGALALGDLPVGGVRTGLGSTVLQCLGFAALVFALRRAAADGPAVQVIAPESVTPPGFVPGLLGICALAFGALQPIPELAGAAIGVGGCLLARAVLTEWDRRRWRRRLDATFEIGVRLAEVADEQAASVRVGLGDVCDAVAEAFRADAAMVWVVEDRGPTLASAGPERLPNLIGIGCGLEEDGDVVAAVCASRKPLVCDIHRPTRGPESPAEAEPIPKVLAEVLDVTELLAVPIQGDEAAMGVLVLGRKAGSPPFSESDQWKALLVGAQIAAVLNQVRRRYELSRELEQTTLVHDFAAESVRAESLNEVGMLLLAKIKEAALFDQGSVRLIDRSAPGGLRGVAHLSGGASPLDSYRAAFRAPIVYRATTVGEILLERSHNSPFTDEEKEAVDVLCRFAAQPLHNHYLREETGKVSELQDQGRAKTDLLRTMAHDLRGPLTVIKGYAESLASGSAGQDPAERAAFLQTIGDEADHLNSLLNHMLDLSAIEAGRLSLLPQIVRLRRLVEQAIASVDSKTHLFVCDVGEEVLVSADRTRLREILDNLIGNAVKYSPGGGPIIVAAEQNQLETMVSVADQGIGIPQRLLQRVFQPFERDSEGAARGIMGTGLGLAIVKGLVEAHGGRIWVESELGVGSTFYFTIANAGEVDVVGS